MGKEYGFFFRISRLKLANVLEYIKNKRISRYLP